MNFWLGIIFREAMRDVFTLPAQRKFGWTASVHFLGRALCLVGCFLPVFAKYSGIHSDNILSASAVGMFVGFLLVLLVSACEKEEKPTTGRRIVRGMHDRGMHDK